MVGANLQRNVWAVLGSNQSRQHSTLDRSEPESTCLQALPRAPWRADFGPEQLSAGSRVVNRWSAGVARAVNAGSLSHLRVHLRLASLLFRVGVDDAERGEAHARAGGLLRAAGRARPGRLLRRPWRVAGALGRERCFGARARSAWSRTAGSGRCCAASTRRAARCCGRRCGSGRSPCGALDVESGEWREEPKRLAPVSGYDLVFSCPKSVSLLHALTDDEAVRREISEAHESAWQAALGYLEREACVVRRGHGGAVREHGDGFVAAAFRHRTSPGAGPASAHARDRRQHGPHRRRRVAGARR